MIHLCFKFEDIFKMKLIKGINTLKKYKKIYGVKNEIILFNKI